MLKTFYRIPISQLDEPHLISPLNIDTLFSRKVTRIKRITKHDTFSKNHYWMRLSRLWRTLQIWEGFIHRDLQDSSYPMKAKFTNCFNLLFVNLFISPFYSLFNNTTSSPSFQGQRFNNLQWAAFLTLFWHHWFNMTKLLTSLGQYNKVVSKCGQQQLVMVNYACGFNQSGKGKYFDWIIISFIVIWIIG